MSSSAAHLLPVAITVSPPNEVLSRASLRTEVQPVTPLISSSSQTRRRGYRSPARSLASITKNRSGRRGWPARGSPYGNG